ncbi:MAG: energy-coupling factor transporter transmembrane component T family protein [Ardenticatenaceae bacterium]
MERVGLYLPGEGMLHRWHPLTKLSLGLASLFLAFADLLPWEGVPLFPWIVILMLAGLAFLDGFRTFQVWLRRSLLLLLPILISLVLVQGFFFPGARDVLLRIGPFSLKSEGLLFGAVIISRLALVVVAMMLIILTTHPADLTHSLTQVGVPREISYVILAAFQLVPRMQARAQSIIQAQQARGLRTEGNLLVRARALLPVIGPLITSALHETEERALALEARAFRAPGPKSSWRQLHDSNTQRLARWLLVLATLVLFVSSRFL